MPPKKFKAVPEVPEVVAPAPVEPTQKPSVTIWKTGNGEVKTITRAKPATGLIEFGHAVSNSFVDNN